jgi:hypothetical protein
LPLDMSQRHTGALPAYFQSKFAQTRADKTHKGMLTECRF